MDNYHIPVLLEEVVNGLEIKPNEEYIDATLGGGGHTKKILEKRGIVLGIDVDQDALEFVKKNLKKEIDSKRLILAKGNFKDIDRIAHLNEFKKVKGIIFDLGVSSHQIDTFEKGFSFLKDGPLDMRMDKILAVTAADLLNILTKGELYEIFNTFGQEHNAWSIANSVIKFRGVKKFKTTNDLVEAVARASGIREKEISDFKKNELCKRVFQALRIAVNSELENLKEGLLKSIELLKGGGRIAVISFHSLEDRIVKEKYKEFEEQDIGRMVTEKPIIPKIEEMNKNSRSKSSKLRIFEKN